MRDCPVLDGLTFDLCSLTGDFGTKMPLSLTLSVSPSDVHANTQTKTLPLRKQTRAEEQLSFF